MKLRNSSYEEPKRGERNEARSGVQRGTMALPDRKEMEDLLTQVEGLVLPMTAEAHAYNDLVDHLTLPMNDSPEVGRLLDLAMRVLRQLLDQKDAPVPLVGFSVYRDNEGLVGAPVYGGPPPPFEMRTEFDVVLTGLGPLRIQTIKVLRLLMGLPLSQAIAVANGPLPLRLCEQVSRAQAEDWVSRLTATGAKAEWR